MKWFNWKSWFKSPRFQKWGLFCLLAVSLGFNLSMNPEHFNNIARYEKGTPMSSFELAQTAAPAAADSTVIAVGGKRGSYKARVFKVEGSAFVKFESTSGECAPGALCAERAMPLRASFDQINDITNELISIVNEDKGVSTSSAETTVTAPKTCPLDLANKPKAGSLTEISDEALKACAQKCVSKKGEDKTTCHQERLIALAKMLEDSDAQASIVEKYFKANLYPSLKNGLMNPTVIETTMEDCFQSESFDGRSGRRAYTASFGLIGCSNTAEFDFSRSIVDSLMSELPSTNGKGVIKLLVYLEKASMTAQAAASKELIFAGQRELNVEKQAFGVNSLNPWNLQAYLSRRTSNLMSLLNERSDTSMNSMYRNMILTGFTSEMNSMLEGMKQCGTQNNGQQVVQQNNGVVPAVQNCQAYWDYQLPVYDGMPTGTTYNPGQPGNTVVLRTGFSRGTPNNDWIQLLGSSINTTTVNGTTVIAPQPVNNQVIQPQPGAPVNRGRGGRG